MSALGSIPRPVGDTLVRLGAGGGSPARAAALVAACYLLRERPRELTVLLPGGLTVQGSSADLVLRYTHVFGVWEPALTALLEGTLATGDTFIDIGANRGYYSSLALRAVGPEGEVVAVEPMPELTGALRRWSADPATGGRLRVIQKAVSDRAGTAVFHLPPDSNLGLGTLTPKACLSGPSCDVETVSLDGLVAAEQIDCNRIGAIKIDVEGGEMAVIRGARGTLSSLRDGAVVIVEIATPEVQQSLVPIMTELGYIGRLVSNSYSAIWYAKQLSAPANPAAWDKSGSGRFPMDWTFTRRTGQPAV
jgi:FkbM family methyltransferase